MLRDFGLSGLAVQANQHLIVHGDEAMLLDPGGHKVYGKALVEISDTGPGIAGEDKERLFVPYFSTKATGMGLGLAIVHQIVTDHGGTIWVEDNLPHGSRFVIELPAGRLAPAPAPVQV